MRSSMFSVVSIGLLRRVVYLDLRRVDVSLFWAESVTSADGLGGCFFESFVEIQK